jgi:hypothetical protein
MLDVHDRLMLVVVLLRAIDRSIEHPPEIVLIQCDLLLCPSIQWVMMENRGQYIRPLPSG